MAVRAVSDEKTKLSKLYIEVLEDLGLNPQLDDDGDVVFDAMSSKGYKLVAIIDEDHEGFMRVALPGLSTVKEGERGKLLEACNYVNLKSKGAKAYISTSGAHVWAAYEVIVDKFSKEGLYEMVAISSVVLEAASEKFSYYLRENA